MWEFGSGSTASEQLSVILAHVNNFSKTEFSFIKHNHNNGFEKKNIIMLWVIPQLYNFLHINQYEEKKVWLNIIFFIFKSIFLYEKVLLEFDYLFYLLFI